MKIFKSKEKMADKLEEEERIASDFETGVAKVEMDAKFALLRVAAKAAGSTSTVAQGKEITVQASSGGNSEKPAANGDNTSSRVATPRSLPVVPQRVPAAGAGKQVPAAGAGKQAAGGAVPKKAP